MDQLTSFKLPVTRTTVLSNGTGELASRAITSSIRAVQFTFRVTTRAHSVSQPGSIVGVVTIYRSTSEDGVYRGQL